MITIKCIVADYQTWQEDKDTGCVKKSILTRLCESYRTIELKRFINGDTSLWTFFFNKMFEACELAKNTRGKLEKVYAYVKVYDEGEGNRYREIVYVQENGGDYTWVIPAVEGLTARNKRVTEHKGPLKLTSEHIMKTAPKIVKYIKEKESARAKCRF